MSSNLLVDLKADKMKLWVEYWHAQPYQHLQSATDD